MVIGKIIIAGSLMTKRQSSKRGKPTQQRLSPSGKIETTDARVCVPSAATFFRFEVLDLETMRQMEKATDLLRPLLWARDGGAVRQIRQAHTAEELIDLLPQTLGLGAAIWDERMREFGSEVLPLISKRLRTAEDIRDENLREITYDKLIGALRWRGTAGAQVPLERFDDLSDYGRGLASVALGLLGEQRAADSIWQFYQRVVHNRRETHFVGALWGLIDLRDKRAGGAVASLLSKGQYFYELFAFLSLAGDTRAIVPLLQHAVQKPREENMDAAMALVSIVHRIGKEALLAELDKVVAPEDSDAEREAFADGLLSTPAGETQEYFALFYRGLTADDLARVFPGRL
jgi:hypothetical protein